MLGALALSVLQGQDFASRSSTPSRAASALEVALGCALLVWAVVAYVVVSRRRVAGRHRKWLGRIEQTHWLVGIAVGAIMLSYGLSKTWVAVVDVIAGVLLLVFVARVVRRRPIPRRLRE